MTVTERVRHWQVVVARRTARMRRRQLAMIARTRAVMTLVYKHQAVNLRRIGLIMQGAFVLCLTASGGVDAIDQLPFLWCAMVGTSFLALNCVFFTLMGTSEITDRQLVFVNMWGLIFTGALIGWEQAWDLSRLLIQ